MTTVGEQVRCRRPHCDDAYSAHAVDGGPCELCDCPGFFWVDPHAAPVSSYREQPQQTSTE